MAADGPDLRRVVITGMGIVSSIGDTIKDVTDSLKQGRSGISFIPEYADKGFKSQVAGKPNAMPEDHVDKRAMRFMGDGAGWCHMSMTQAIADAGLDESIISNPRTGLIVGTGGPSHARHRGGRGLDPRKRLAPPHRAVRRAQGDVVDRVGDALHALQDSRRELFDLVGLHDLAALRRRGHRTDPVGQAGRDVRRRRRGTRLDALLPSSMGSARCRRNTMPSHTAPRAPMTPIAMAS